MNRVDSRDEEQIRSLLEHGFEAGWISDLTIGDIFTAPRLFMSDDYEFFVVERINHLEASYFNEEDELQQNVVVNMIVRDEKDLQRHLSYGHTHDIYIYRGSL